MEGKTGLRFGQARTIEERGEILRFWIGLVRDIYCLSDVRDRRFGYLPTGYARADGPISVLTVSPGGELRFSSR